MAVLNLYKELGETPLDAMNKYKKDNPDFQNEKMTYAGRLDPMAEGVLVVLTGEDIHRKDEFLSLDKVYLAEILIGVETDSHDVLGLIQSMSDKQVDSSVLKKELDGFVGANELPFPKYSSYKVKGKPLHEWTRSGLISQIKIPLKTMIVQEVETVHVDKVLGEEVVKKCVQKISKVEGDFRQKEIIDDWEKNIDRIYEHQIVHVRIHCKSGTYIRAVAEELGKRLDTGACLYHLLRERVGDFAVKDGLKALT